MKLVYRFLKKVILSITILACKKSFSINLYTLYIAKSFFQDCEKSMGYVTNRIFIKSLYNKANYINYG